MTCEHYMKFIFSVHKVLLELNFDHFHIVYGSFCITEELSSCDKNGMAHKSKIFTIWPFVENNLPTSALEYFINLEMLGPLEP